MEHYLGVRIQTKLFKSPLRSDRNPTCSFYRDRRGRLIMKDWSGAFSGDCFSVVMEKFQCSYYMALQIIANDFGIIHRPNLKKNKPKMDYSGIKIEERKPATIKVQTREFTQEELNWWLKYGINTSTLKKFKVYPIDNVWLNDNLFYSNITDQPVFGYYGGIRNNIETWRIYFTTRRKYRFISNWSGTQIQGLQSLTRKSDFLVITKSLKDVMVLYEYGITAIAPCSENLFVTETQYNKLKERYKHIYLLYDADLPGVRASKKIKKNFPDVKILLLPWGTAKDISDYRKMYGHRKTKDLINQALLYYGEKIE